MPPAFVLSQDQTLRKNKFLSEISDLAFLFDSVVPTAQIHQSVTSHYSVFKQHRSFHRHPPLFSSVSFNLASFGFLSNPNLKIFQFFSLSQTTAASLSQRSVSFNLALSEFFASSNLKKIQFFQEKSMHFPADLFEYQEITLFSEKMTFPSLQTLQTPSARRCGASKDARLRNFCGSHSTRSAALPGAITPRSCNPKMEAGNPVIFQTIFSSAIPSSRKIRKNSGIEPNPRG